MNLLQEYYLRNNVCSPFVLHGSGHLLLAKTNKKKSKDRYRICEIKSLNEGGNDGLNIGKFDIHLYAPIKYQAFTNNCYLTKENHWVIYWDEFEKLIINKAHYWKHAEGWMPVSDKDEMKVAFWEMLSYSYDSKFSELPIKFLDFNYSIFDENISVQDRAALVESAALAIGFYSDSINNHACNIIKESWLYFVGLMSSPKYAYWLSKLMKDI